MPQSGDPTQLPAWQQLTELASTVGRQPIGALMQARAQPLTARMAGLTLDYSRQHVDGEVMRALFALADQAGVSRQREAMFNGEPINVTEQRAALHTALRGASDVDVVAENAHDAALGVLHDMKIFADGVRSEAITGFTGKPFRTVINIGIGGSDLGPAMAYQALRPYADQKIALRFVSNIDPDDLREALEGANPETTLFLIASKTFTTAETMRNAANARSWLVEQLGAEAVGDHFVALSSAPGPVAEFGIRTDRTFGFWDWVGGRYSLGSAIGLSLMIAIGPAAFTIMLDGFQTVDTGFRYAPDDQNIPLIMGLLGIWNRNFLNISTVVVLPYAHRLRRFPAYLQQLIMESNGKSVRVDGAAVSYQTTPVYWGEAGTNGQHSFHQFLHQGTEPVACDVIVVARPFAGNQDQQHELVAHALAQSTALALGRSHEEVLAAGLSREEAPHRVMSGGRPTNVLVTRELDPFALGALIATYEHMVFTQAAIWGINPFDQWGVELGKQLATSIMQQWDSKDPDAPLGTAELLGIIRDAGS